MNTSQESSEKIAALQTRALFFQKVRTFFAERSVLEVDCPALGIYPALSEHIDVFEVEVAPSNYYYLHTSPEHGMKRLLSEGIGDIFQLSHVFRKNELAHLHNCEFSMVEWYRLGMSYENFIEETLLFIQMFLNEVPVKKLSYKEIFLQFTGINYLEAAIEDLLAFMDTTALSYPKDLNRDDLLIWIMAFVIEPQLKSPYLWVITDFPASQAALSQTTLNAEGYEVAKRFEVYFNGIELANGYLELTSEKIQRERFIEANKRRKELGKECYPLDELLIQALKKGLPACCGVAVGFDRLLMLHLNKKHLKDVIPYSFDEA